MPNVLTTNKSRPSYASPFLPSAHLPASARVVPRRPRARSTALLGGGGSCAAPPALRSLLPPRGGALEARRWAVATEGSRAGRGPRGAAMAEEVGALRQGAAGRGRARGIPACLGAAVGLRAARLEGTAWGRAGTRSGCGRGRQRALCAPVGAQSRSAQRCLAWVGSLAWDCCCRDPLGALPAVAAAASGGVFWASGKAEPGGDRDPEVNGRKMRPEGILARAATGAVES